MEITRLINVKRIRNDFRFGEGIYLLYFALMVGARAAGLYEGMTLYNISLVIGMLLFAFKMIVTKHSAKEYLIAGAFMLLAAIVYIHTGEKGLIVCFTMMLGMKNVSVRKVIKTGALVSGIIVLLKIFLGVFGLTSEIYYPQERDGIGLMFRHSLGYAHPNTLHMNVMMLSMMVMYLVTDWIANQRKLAIEKKDSIDRQNIFLFFIVSIMVMGFNYYVFQYSGSRTGIMACLVYFIVNTWLFLINRIGIFERTVSYLAFYIVSFIAIPLPFILQGKIFDIVNSTIFTNRFFLARYFWENNGVSLWGIRLNSPYEPFRTYGIDMAQLYLFLQLGLVAFVVMALLTTWYVHQAIKFDNRSELAVLMAMLFVGIWEPLLYNLGFKNFAYVFIGAMIYKVVDGQQLLSIRQEVNSVANDISYDSIPVQISLKQIVILFLVPLMVGVIVSAVYIATSNAPTALYGDRAEDESGKSLGIEAVYLDEKEVEQLKSNGDIIIGYTDAETPMYKYDETIAEMEYQKRTLSTGVWSGILVFGIALCTIKMYNTFNKKEHGKA